MPVEWERTYWKVSGCYEQERQAVIPRRKQPEKLMHRESIPGMTAQSTSEEA